jgi:ribosomal protein L12E/L44/L45/RPP1/RPP2
VLIALALLQLNGASPTPPVPGPVRIDLRGGGGGPGATMHDVETYANVLAAFREIPGESPLARAVRRAEHLRRGLEQAQRSADTAERAMAIGMLYGATLERMAQEAARAELAKGGAATTAAAGEASAAPARAAERRDRHGHEDRARGGGLGGLLALLVGVGTAVAITRKRR